MLNFHSKDQKKAASDLTKPLGMTSREVQKQLDGLAEAGVLKLVHNKFMINEEFNSQTPKLKEISLLPDPNAVLVQDTKALEALNLAELSSSRSGPNDPAQAATNLQNKFMETLKYRIDSRILKNLKGRKTGMKL